MTDKTANSYVSDGGELEITITAADVTALAAFTTAEAIVLDGVLRKLEETNPSTRQYSEVFVTAEDFPIKTMSAKQSATVWSLMMVDDYHGGDAGEWGTDNISAYEIFEAFFIAKREISELKVSPAGGSTGTIQITLDKVDVQTLPQPMIDADSTTPNEITLTLVVESYDKAAHA
jgi:hypothetical protein